MDSLLPDWKWMSDEEMADIFGGEAYAASKRRIAELEDMIVDKFVTELEEQSKE